MRFYPKLFAATIVVGMLFIFVLYAGLGAFTNRDKNPVNGVTTESARNVGTSVMAPVLIKETTQMFPVPKNTVANTNITVYQTSSGDPTTAPEPLYDTSSIIFAIFVGFISSLGFYIFAQIEHVPAAKKRDYAYM